MDGDRAYHTAMKRRAELRQELDEIETFLRLYEKFAGAPASHITTLESPPLAEGDLTVAHSDNSAPTSAQPATHVETAGMTLVPHIRHAILDTGRPQSRGGI